MARITLIRHSQSEHNLRRWRVAGSVMDSRLTERGKQQAVQVAERLSATNELPEVIYHSTAVRTRRMAEIIASKLDPSPIIKADARLSEMDQGHQAGKLKLLTLTNPVIFFGLVLRGRDYAFPGGESFNQVGKRMVAALSDIESKYSGAVIVLSHGMAIRCALAYRDKWSVWRLILTPAKHNKVFRWQ